MKSKISDDPVFLITTLIVFFPVGLILLMRADQPRLRKLIFGLCGGTAFALLLCTGLLFGKTSLRREPMQLIVTRESLSVGQSGGFALLSDSQLQGELQCTLSNDCLTLNGSVYTAASPGECLLTVTCGEETFTQTILVQKGPGTDTTVLASPSAERYHLETAKHAGKQAIRMSEEDALQSGKTPCKICYKR